MSYWYEKLPSECFRLDNYHSQCYFIVSSSLSWILFFLSTKSMNREEAFSLLTNYLKNKNLIKHSLSVEAGMRKLADYFDEDPDTWGLAGLLHDIDYEMTKESPEKHSLVGAEILSKEGLASEVIEAVKTHNGIHGVPPVGRMAQSLFCLDPLTGLIVASALVLPSHSLKDLSIDSLLKRFHEKSFARGAHREIIEKCEEYLELDLRSFCSLGLMAMQDISKSLDLA